MSSIEIKISEKERKATENARDKAQKATENARDKAIEKERKATEKATEKERKATEKATEKERKTTENAREKAQKATEKAATGRTKANTKENEEKDITDIVNAINNDTPQGIQIKPSYYNKFGSRIKSARSSDSDGNKVGGRNIHYDLEVHDDVWKRVEHKGKTDYTPIDVTISPWTTGVQFYNGTASKFGIGKKYADDWYTRYIESGEISNTYGILSPIPTRDEWIKDAMRQGDPKTKFGMELKSKFREMNPGKSLINERNQFVDTIFIPTAEDLDILKKEALTEANRVLREKDLWLQIHGDINSDFYCEWTGPVEINDIKRAYTTKKGSKDVNFIFECEDNFKFGGILRWGKGAGFSNLRIDLK